jgi:hypothetical protein
VFVLRLRDKRESATGIERGVLDRIRTEGDARNGHDP